MKRLVDLRKRRRASLEDSDVIHDQAGEAGPAPKVMKTDKDGETPHQGKAQENKVTTIAPASVNVAAAPTALSVGLQLQILVRSPIWYEDGNVVLQAQNTLFKVHRGVLAGRSSTLKNCVAKVMISPSAPPVEGCPVFVMKSLSQDITHMLHIFYGHPDYTNVRTPMPVNIIGAMLRVDRDYGVPSLKNEAHTRLALEFPASLEQWTKRNWERALHVRSSDDPKDEGQPMVKTALDLALEFRITQVLPTLFVEACNIHYDFSWDQPLSQSDSFKVAGHLKKMRGYKLLSDARIGQVYSWAAEVGNRDECESRSACNAASHNLMKIFWANPKASVKDTFKTWSMVKDQHNDDLKGLCNSCLAYAKTAHTAARSKVWDALPKHFGLDSVAVAKD